MADGLHVRWLRDVPGLLLAGHARRLAQWKTNFLQVKSSSGDGSTTSLSLRNIDRPTGTTNQQTVMMVHGKLRVQL